MTTRFHQRSPRRRRSGLPFVGFALVLVSSSVASARVYTLPELIQLARRGNAGLAAGAEATAGIEAQLAEARRSRLPSGELYGLVTASPDIKCRSDNPILDMTDKTYRQNNCLGTNVSEVTLKFSGVFTRTELKLTQPLFTFGKISAGIEAAEAGVAASRSREGGMAAELELNIRRAYWGMKLAREILDTLNEGLGYIADAEKKIDKDLAEGTGDATTTDRFRLRTVRAEVEARTLEAKRLRDVAQGGLRALIGPDAPDDIDVDAAPLEALVVPSRPLGHYEQQALLSRPEVRALESLVASKRALAKLERRKLYPDLVLVGSATFAYASSVDNPRNAFANDPFNTLSFGMAAALRMPLDLFVKDARAARMAAEAEETASRRREALGGIAYEVEKAFNELHEATERTEVVNKGEKAGRAWITSVAQKFAVGLAEAKDFSDALVAFFQMRVRYLQALMDVNVAAAALSRATGAEVTSSAGTP